MTTGLPGGASGKEPPCQCRRHKRHGLNIWVRKSPWRKTWQPTQVFLPEESQHLIRAWQIMVHRVAKSWTRLKRLSMHTRIYASIHNPISRKPLGSNCELLLVHHCIKGFISGILEKNYVTFVLTESREPCLLFIVTKYTASNPVCPYI